MKKASQVLNCVICVLLLLLQLTPACALVQEESAANMKTYSNIDTSWYTGSKNQYIISTEAQLRGLSTLVNEEGRTFAGATILLKNDITLTEHENVDNWNPIGFSATNYFGGVFDGGGHAISGLVLNSLTPYRGLFGYIEGAVLKDLTVSGAVHGGDYTGGIVGYAGPGTSFENCTSQVAVSSTNYVGGLVGHAAPAEDREISFKNCVNQGDVLATASSVGGIVGRVYNLEKYGDLITAQVSFSDCVNKGDITGDKYTGGIAGEVGTSANYVFGEFNNCRNLGKIQGGSSGYTGGIVGYSYTPPSKEIRFKDCINKGSITDLSYYTGGVAGYLSGLVSLENCSNEGQIHGGNNTGGVAGYISGGSDGGARLENCHNTGSVQGSSGDYVGGVVGYTSGTLGTLKDCYNTGNVTGKSTVGGVVASLGGGKQGITTVTQCYNTGKISSVSSNSITGGVFGYVGDSFFDGITFCFNTGPVISSGKYTGGVAAYLVQNSRLNYCYNLRDIASTASAVKGVGGIVGYSSYPVTSYAVNCYNTGQITATASDPVGAISGSGYESNTDCFYDVAAIAEPADASKVTPLTAEDFASGKAAYLLDKGDQNFRTRLWSQGESYPLFAEANSRPVYKITVEKYQNGENSSSADQQDLYSTAGREVRLAITPKEGYIPYLLTVTDRDGEKYEVAISTDGDEAIFTMPETDVTVISTFVEVPSGGPYTVSFDSNGGTSDYEPQSVQAGKRAKNPGTPAKEGFVFIGWYLGNAEYDFNTAVMGDITLVAHWREEGKYIVTFNVNRGKGGTGSKIPPKQTVFWGMKVEEPDEPIWDSDDVTILYQFTGWYTARVEGEKWDFAQDEVTGNLILYAKWEELDAFTTGTKGNPFKIESLEVLGALAERVNRNTGDNRGYGGHYFQLVGDIALPGDWSGIGYSGGKSPTVLGTSPNSDLLPFNGYFDGGGHTITLDGNQTVSPFGSVGLEGVVANLRVEGVLESIPRNSFGGIAGVNHGFISSCSTSLKDKDEGINAGSVCGGIVGANFGGIKDCSAFVEFNANGIHIGGIVGYMKGGDKYRSVENCTLLEGSNIVSNGKYGAYGGAVGGIVATMASLGVNDGFKVVDCTVEEARIAYKGNFSGATAGGVVGYAMVEISNCKSAATVEGLDYVGGIVGQINSVAGPVLMRQCVNAGQVSGRNYVDDLLGSGTAKIIDCYSIIETGDGAPSLPTSALSTSLSVMEQVKGNDQADKNVPQVPEAEVTSIGLSDGDFQDAEEKEPEDKKPTRVFEIVKKTVEENPLVAALLGLIVCSLLVFSGIWRYRQYRKSF